MNEELEDYEDWELARELYERHLNDEVEDDIYGVSDHKGTMYVINIKKAKDLSTKPFNGIPRQIVQEIAWLEHYSNMDYIEIAELYNVDEYIVYKIEGSDSKECKPLWYDKWETEHENK